MQCFSDVFPVKMLTVNTSKTGRSLAIFPKWKSYCKHLVFLCVFCSFPDRVNAMFVVRFLGLNVDG